MKTEKCFVAVSGGVDSAVTLCLLQKAGYSVEGITMKNIGSELLPGYDDSELSSARALCEARSVPHRALSLEKEFFDAVIGDFIASYEQGDTPNPCVVCNKKMKFGLLAEYAFSQGADMFATGHYVRMAELNGRRVIKKALCPEKDQSYVLWSLTQEQLARFIAPLGEYSKSEVRELARELVLPMSEKKDSQDICFIKNGDYRSFLDRVTGRKDAEGDFVLSDGEKVGRHTGCRCYTVGQRKGLGIAWKEPLYVIGRNTERNEIVLGTEDMLMKSSFVLRDSSFSAIPEPESDFFCSIRTRYHSPETRARIIPLGEKRLLVETEMPVRAVTPGQSCVFYDGDLLLGGGIIEKRQNGS